MKQFTVILMFAVAFLAVACGGNSGVSKDGPEYTSAYICPMHCAGSGSAKAGNCPDCKMAYMPNKDFKSAEDHSGHNHDGHDHSGHDHGDHEGHNHDVNDGHDHSGHNH